MAFYLAYMCDLRVFCSLNMCVYGQENTRNAAFMPDNTALVWYLECKSRANT